MNTKSLGAICLVVIASTVLGSGFYKLLDGQRKVEIEQAGYQDTDTERMVPVDAGVHPHIVERVISSSQLWRPVQDRVKDTVVQIFSHISVTNLLQPYASPNQGIGYGSGFFISDEGHIITNAHVIDQAKPWIQVPSLGKRIIDVDVIGVSPDRDLALLKVSAEGLDLIRRELGAVPFLPLGDSDLVRRSDDVLALGYPLGQQSLKSTTGVISGREQNLIQIDAAINPGSSGGPCLNTRGEVIGINSSGIVEAQSVGYAIPINDLKIILPDLHRVKLLRRPFLGVLFNNGTDAMVSYLGNPAPGGCPVVEVIPGSPLAKVGVQRGDMIYEINGYPVDMFGEMKLPFNEDKISIIDYVSRLAIGDSLHLVVYRNGGRREFDLTFGLPEQPAIHEVYPGYENLDYEVFAGMVVMPLTLNHLPLLGKQAPGLAKYIEAKHQAEPTLIITHIFPNSQMYRSRGLPVGSTINEINGIRVHTLDEFREAVKRSEKSGFLTVRASDNVTRKSDNILVVLSWQKIIEEEPRLSRDFRYPMTQLAQNILQSRIINKSLEQQMKVPTAPDLVVAAAKASSPAA